MTETELSIVVVFLFQNNHVEKRMMFCHSHDDDYYNDLDPSHSDDINVNETNIISKTKNV